MTCGKAHDGSKYTRLLNEHICRIRLCEYNTKKILQSAIVFNIKVVSLIVIDLAEVHWGVQI